MPRAPRSTSRRATAALTSTLLLLGVTVVSSPVAHGEGDDDRSAPPAGADAVWPTPDWELGDQTGRAQRGGAHRAASGREFLGTDGAVYQSAPVATKGRNGTIYYGEEFDNACGDGASFRHGLEGLDALADIITRSGRKVVFTVAPNKSAVNTADMAGVRYPHGRCDRRGIKSQSRTLDTFKSRHYVPVRRELADLAKSSQVYWRVDTHWTTVGNTRLAEALAKRLGPKIADAQSYAKGKRTITPDIATLLGKPDLRETAPARLTTTKAKVRTVHNSDPYDPFLPTGLDHSWRTSPKATSFPGKTLIIGDSFAYVALESIRPLFQKGRFVWVGQLSLSEIINAIPRYDTVVIEVVQRFLTRSVLTQESTRQAVKRALKKG